eukprot:1158081-Pelagomonas_calceolata.AAC.8
MGLGALGTGWLVLSRGLRPGGANKVDQDSSKGGRASGSTSRGAGESPTVEAESKLVDGRCKRRSQSTRLVFSPWLDAPKYGQLYFQALCTPWVPIQHACMSQASRFAAKLAC